MGGAHRIAGAPRRLLPVAVCALGGHFVLYRSFRPSGGNHAYFAWYGLLVAGLTVAALAALGLLLLAAVVGRGPWRGFARALLSGPHGDVSVTGRALRLALASVVFLVVQESLERSLAEGRLALGSLSPSETLLLLAVVASLALLVAVVERSCRQLIARLAGGSRRLRRSRTPLSPPVAAAPIRRRHPLAEMRGLRAPPLPG